MIRSHVFIYLPYFILTALALTGASVYGQDCEVRGEIKGIGKTPIQFLYKQKGHTQRDTVYAIEDRFTYQPRPSDDGTFDIFISYPRWAGAWYEKAHLTVSGSVEKPYLLTITGGPENDAATRYNQAIRWPYNEKIQQSAPEGRAKLWKEQQEKTLQFVRENPAAKISAELLQSLTFEEDIPITDLERLYAELTPEVQKSAQGKDAAQRIEITKNQPAKGKPAPGFKLPSSSGSTVSLADFKGKYVLLDFWGHWCGPCIKAMPGLRAIHEKYKQNLTIIGVAAEHDDDRQVWLNTIQKHQAKWVHVSEFEGDKGKVNTTYNIYQFPTYFLLDKKGTVLGKANDLAGVETLLSGLSDL